MLNKIYNQYDDKMTKNSSSINAIIKKHSHQQKIGMFFKLRIYRLVHEPISDRIG